MEGLGLDLKLLIAQIFNFLVLLFVLKKFLYKPILNFLDERKKKIEESLITVEKINKKLSEIEDEKKRIIHEASLEAARIISQEKKLGEEETERISEEARRKAQEELRKGVVLVQQELEKAKREVRLEAIKISQEMVMKILDKLPDEDKRKLLEKALADKV